MTTFRQVLLLLLALPIAGMAQTTAIVPDGRAVTLTVDCGPGVFTYQWRKNGIPVVGATNETHVVAPFAPTDAGVYSVEIANAAGFTVSDNATLLFAPASSGLVLTLAISNASQIVTTQTTPTQTDLRATVPPTRKVDMSVAAAGAAQTYQWSKDRYPIPGATTQTISITSFASANVGSYTVVATKPTGSATAGSIILELSAAPTRGTLKIIVSGSSTTTVAPK